MVLRFNVLCNYFVNQFFADWENRLTRERCEIIFYEDRTDCKNCENFTTTKISSPTVRSPLRPPPCSNSCTAVAKSSLSEGVDNSLPEDVSYLLVILVCTRFW